MRILNHSIIRHSLRNVWFVIVLHTFISEVSFENKSSSEKCYRIRKTKTDFRDEKRKSDVEVPVLFGGVNEVPATPATERKLGPAKVTDLAVLGRGVGLLFESWLVSTLHVCFPVFFLYFG